MSNKICVDFVTPVGSIPAYVEAETIEAAWDMMATNGYVDGVTKNKPQKVRFFRASCAAMAENPDKPAAVVVPLATGKIIRPGAH